MLMSNVMAHVMIPENRVQASSAIYVARQPIFHANQTIYGYELLFRSSLENFFNFSVDADQATSKVITNTFLLIGIKKLAEGRKVFINFPTDMIINEYPDLLPNDITVVEILESVDPSSEDVVSGCKNLVNKGYSLALDDFSFHESWVDLIKLQQFPASRKSLTHMGCFGGFS